MRELSTDGVRVTQQGVDVVERHLARFGPESANQGMVSRLRDVASGNLAPEAVDMNFYTHELREYVRYRQLGFQSGAGADYTLWNNAHSATLADYRLVEGRASSTIRVWRHECFRPSSVEHTQECDGTAGLVSD